MRDIVKLVASDGSGHFYTTTKNKRTKSEKMQVRKFNPIARKYMIYKEEKI